MPGGAHLTTVTWGRWIGAAASMILAVRYLTILWFGYDSYGASQAVPDLPITPELFHQNAGLREFLLFGASLTLCVAFLRRWYLLGWTGWLVLVAHVFSVGSFAYPFLFVVPLCLVAASVRPRSASR